MASKDKGLLLVLGNAPHTPHVVPGVPGLFRPDRPTPVGGPGEPSLDVAEAVSKDPGTHLKLVDIPSKDLAGLRELAAADVEASRVVVASPLETDGAETVQLSDEKQAVLAVPRGSPTAAYNTKDR